MNVALSRLEPRSPTKTSEVKRPRSMHRRHLSCDPSSEAQPDEMHVIQVELIEQLVHEDCFVVKASRQSGRSDLPYPGRSGALTEKVSASRS